MFDPEVWRMIRTLEREHAARRHARLQQLEAQASRRPSPAARLWLRRLRPAAHWVALRARSRRLRLRRIESECDV